MQERPTAEHAWLQRLVGDWEYEVDAAPGPGDPSDGATGTEAVRPIGDLWVTAEGQGQMPDGSPAETVMTLGWDPGRGRFVGTFIGSMMSHLWIYEGTLDPDGRTLTLAADGPDMENPDRTAAYRDIIEFQDDDHRTLTALVQGPNGDWQRLMSMRYRRTAAP